MNSATYKFTQGGDALAAAFANLASDMRNRTLVAGVTAMVQPVVVAAKRFAKRSEDTGALRESITYKVKNYPGTNKCVGLVGPDRDYYSKGRRVKGVLSRAIARNQRRPAAYAHLIEYGHVVAKGGSLRDRHEITLKPTVTATGKTVRRWKRGAVIEKAKGSAGGFVPPKPFIRPAVLTTTAQQENAFFGGIEKGFLAAVAREERAGRHVSSK